LELPDICRSKNRKPLRIIHTNAMAKLKVHLVHKLQRMVNKFVPRTYNGHATLPYNLLSDRKMPI